MANNIPPPNPTDIQAAQNAPPATIPPVNASDLEPGKKTPMPAQGDVVSNYAAQQAAAQPSPWAQIDARLGQNNAATQNVPREGQPTNTQQDQQVDQPQIKTSIGTQLDMASQQAAKEAQGQSFVGKLGEAAKGGITQSLADFSGKLPEGNKDYEQPFALSDLKNPEVAVSKAVYQLAHGSPVLAGGIGGGIAGGIVGNAPGAAVGGALGAGTIAAAQGLNGYFQNALKQNPDPDAAFNQALKQAGTSGIFSAAGWLAFGAAPFEGAVKNLLFQAGGIQPAIAAGGQVAQNAESGQPLTQGVGSAAATGAVMTALPLAAGKVVDAAIGRETPPTNNNGNEPPPPSAPLPQIDPEKVGEPLGSNVGEIPTSTPETQATVAEHAEEHINQPSPTVEPINQDAPVGFSFAKQAGKEDSARLMDYLNGKSGDNPVQASVENWGNELTRADLTQMASHIENEPVRHDDAVRTMAYTLGTPVDDLMQMGRDKLLSDHEMLAFKASLDAMGSRTFELAKQAASSNDPHDWDAATAAMSNLRDAQDIWQKQGTETARALRQRRGDINPDTGKDYLPEINKIIAGTQTESDLRDAVARVALLDTPEKVSPFVANLQKFFSRDNMVSGWYQMLLSNPEVLGKKQGSDLLMLGRDLSSGYIAEKTGALPPGTTLFKLNSIFRSHQDAFKAFGTAWKEGRSQYGSTFQDVSQHEPEFYENLNQAYAPQEPPGEELPTQTFMDTLKANIPWPTRVIGALDDMNKVFRERGSLAEQLYIKGHDKGLRDDDLKSYVNENMSNPSYRMQKIAVQEAQRGTLQEKMGVLTSNIASFVDNTNIPIYGEAKIPVGKIIMPFIRIASNTMRESYRMTPAYALSDEYANLGGVAKAKANATMGLGTAFSLAAVPFIMNNTITGGGPANPQERAAWRSSGFEPYSVKVGGKWFGYRAFEPLGFMLGTLADTTETIKYAPEESGSDLAMSFVRGAGSALLNASYLGSVAGFFDSILSKNPAESPGRWWQNTIASMAVPQGVNMVAQGVDPYMREHRTLMDTIQSRIPWKSESLQPMLDAWGNPVKNKEHLVRGVIPMTVGDATGGNVQPIDKWIWDHYQSFPNGPQGSDGMTRPSSVITHGEGGAKASYKLTPEQYTEYQKLAGHGIKDNNGMGAVDYLNALVKGNNPDDYTQDQWNEGSDEKKALLVHQTVMNFRQLAKQKIMDEYPEIQHALDAQIQAKQQKLSQ